MKKSIYALLVTAFMCSCSPTSIELNEESIIAEGYKNTTLVCRNSWVELSGSSEQVLDGSTISLNGEDSWLFLPNISREQWASSELSDRILINDEPLQLDVNASLINYYNGVYLKPIASPAYSPATFYSERKKECVELKLDYIYKSDEVPLQDDAPWSIFLKKGHMMILAENSDGTGESKTYIAICEDVCEELPSELQGKVSFARVVAWNYVPKRGMGGGVKKVAALGELDVKWYYNWGYKDRATASMDFAPMFWSNNAQGGIDKVIGDSATNHILAFNEPDGGDQSNLSPEEAVRRYPALLATGLRIGSPACREGNWKNWLSEFMEGCEKNNYRVDFIATHWYDWGNWAETHDESPENVDAIVERFKRDIDNCYKKYGLPIWITEFNANKNRLTAIQIEFLERAIPMLEAHPHVERYAYFQPFGGNGDFVKDGALTPTAKAYACIESTPSIPEKAIR
ncbi:MAG: glycosyl hydrolase [Rikenellaceae bacterium]